MDRKEQLQEICDHLRGLYGQILKKAIGRRDVDSRVNLLAKHLKALQQHYFEEKV